MINSEDKIARRVYMDHAATSWPKMPGVTSAWIDYQERVGITAGRGSYRSSVLAQSIVDDVRRRLAGMIGAKSASSIAMVHNGTAALNLAFSGLLKAGDHVVTTAAEHNSVLRPLHLLSKTVGIRLTIVDCDATGWVDPKDIQRSLEPKTRMVAITHASNVTGRIQSIDTIGKMLASSETLFLVDAAQTLGYIPIDVESLGIDLLAAPGHKGAGGVMGCGMLYANELAAIELNAPWVGGSGTQSESLAGPAEWPAKAEAGNLNIPAIAAWQAGLKWLDSIHEETSNSDRETSLFHPFVEEHYRRLLDILRMWKSCSVIGHEREAACDKNMGLSSSTDHQADKTHDTNFGQYVPVVSLRSNSPSVSVGDLAAILDSSFDIEVRSGLHCAALIHEKLGTLREGGTVRFSIGHTTTHEDLDHLEIAIQELNGVMP
jgi:cysteine desulfurase / selenocysteine lyase